MENNWWKLIGIVGVLVGFFCTLLYNWYIRSREQKMVGETFNLQLSIVRKPIVAQTYNLIEYEKKIRNFEYAEITIYLYSQFNLLKTLDQLKLVKFFNKGRKRKKGQASSYVGKIYNQIDILILQTSKLDKVYEKFHADLYVLMRDYKRKIDGIRREVAFFQDQLPIKERNTDSIVNKWNELDEKYILKRPIDLKMMTELYTTYHLDIMVKIPADHKHKLYSKIMQANFDAKDIVSDIMQLCIEHLHFLELQILSHKECYKTMYHEEIEKAIPNFKT